MAAVEDVTPTGVDGVGDVLVDGAWGGVVGGAGVEALEGGRRVVAAVGGDGVDGGGVLGGVDRVQNGESKVPYGVAIAAGALVAFLKAGYLSGDFLIVFLSVSTPPVL